MKVESWNRTNKQPGLSFFHSFLLRTIRDKNGFQQNAFHTGSVQIYANPQFVYVFLLFRNASVAMLTN